MATPGTVVDRSDGAPVDRSTTPTGVADFDFALPTQGEDDDAWAEVNTPLHKASYLWKTHPMQVSQRNRRETRGASRDEVFQDEGRNGASRGRKGSN
jgi:hypothetical protein